MKLQPIVYTPSMERSAEWYSAVLGVPPEYQSEVWTSFGVRDAHLGLHRVDEPVEGARVGLSLVAVEPLEEIVARLREAGVAVERGIQEETFGRSILLRDPDDLIIQVNEHHSHA